MDITDMCMVSMLVRVKWKSWMKPFAYAIAILLGLNGIARAEVFDFTYSQGNPSGFLFTLTGTLTGSATGNSNFTITQAAGTGSFTIGTFSESFAITGISSPDTSFGADNTLYSSTTPMLSTLGLTFTTDGSGSDGSGTFNIAYSTFNQAYVSTFEIGIPNGRFNAVAEAVPEPASLALLSAGLGGLLAMRRRAAKA